MTMPSEDCVDCRIRINSKLQLSLRIQTKLEIDNSLCKLTQQPISYGCQEIALQTHKHK